MVYTYRVFDSIDDVILADWQHVRSASEQSVFTDPRLIAAVEISMKQSSRFWHVVVYEEKVRPVACATLSAITVDLLSFADPVLALIVGYLPGVRSILRELKVLMCGIPVSAGQKSLAIAPRPGSRQILETLDEAIADLASKNGMHLIVYKEFWQGDLEWMNPLQGLGYRCIPTAPMHLFRTSFQDLQHYCASLRSAYRWQIKNSLRKLERMGVETSILTDPEEIMRVYTPEVHGLYYQTLNRADRTVEILPIEFFRELTIHLQGRIDLIILSKSSEIVAFGWSVRDGATYHMLYLGVNYEMNSDADLYFNVVYASLDRALRQRVSRIQVGQTTGAFKAKLGCYSEPLYTFVKGRGLLMSLMVRYGAGLLIAQEPAAPPFNVFRRDPVETRN